MNLSDSSKLEQSEFERYARHLSLPQFGVEGQVALKQSRVTIIGCGGLGAPVSLYLAAAGVGEIKLVDSDTVALSNLQRQITFTERDIGRAKAEVTREALLTRNSSIKVEAVQTQLNNSNAQALLSDSDLVLDCCDNAPTRYVINENCRRLGIPWVYASIFQFSGQCALIKPTGPCFQCIFPDTNAQAASCNEAGVIGVLPGVMGSIQSLTAIKQLANLEPVETTELILVETLEMQMRRIRVEQRSDCPVCRELPDHRQQQQVGNRLHEKAQTMNSSDSPTIDCAELQQLMANDAIYLIDVRERDEHMRQNIGGSNIPLSELATAQLPLDRPIVFYCQMGARSLQAQQWASAVADHDNCRSLEGGIVRFLENTPSA